MIYLDYSATTPVNKSVLDSFCDANIKLVGNANSMHLLGVHINEFINSATKQIKDILSLDKFDIIYTSSASEANNLALKGICEKYKNRGKKIITTKFEHSSINETVKYLETKGFQIIYVNSLENGKVDINDLKNKMTDDTILVSITHVNSELGIVNDVEEIGLLLKNYPKCFFHVDLTQSLGKIKVDMTNIDLASISAHKIYGLKGIGALIKKKNINLEPLIHGGKSTTIYRSGTPAHPLIASFSKAIRLIQAEILDNYEYVSKLNKLLINELKNIPEVLINSNEYSIPHIINFSVKGIKAETLMNALAEHDIYVSTKTACSSDDYSESVYELTKDLERSKSSIRVSLSHLTKVEEIEEFVKCLKQCINNLLL